MSLKQEIETWVKALGHYDNNEFDESLRSFDAIADTSKILFNCGVIRATLGEHEKAVDCYIRAIKLDQYLAVAYFQQGVSNFLMGDFEEALANFNDTLLYLRGNNNIDYEQLGLKFKLYSCEVLFNRGLCYIYLQQVEQGMQDLTFAAKEKVVPDHDVIDEAIRESADGYTVFSIPVGIVYRPNEAKVKNLKAKDYLGKARLVAATDRNNAFTGFAGAEMKRMAGPEGAKDDRPEEKISFAASNLVKADLKSRYRQQSEPPPPNRNVFPPTPPPEGDRTSNSSGSQAGPNMTRADSVRAGPRPRPLDLTIAGFERPKQLPPQPQSEPQPEPDVRPAPPQRSRTQSERPPERAYSDRGYPQQMQRRSTERRAPPPARGIRSPDSYRSRPDSQGAYDEVYDMYSRQSTGGRGRMPPRDPGFIEEEEDDYIGSYDEGDFEMVGGGRYGSSASYPRNSRQRRSGPEVRKIRVKVHADDTRYVMVGTAVEFKDFIDQIRLKFGIRQSFKVKIKDEGDMITMADQDDLDMAIQQSKDEARRERSEMGKMEIWVQAV